MARARRSPKPEPGRTEMVLVPSEAMFSSTRSLLPVPSATTDTTEAMPMMIPSMVRKLRSRCAFSARTAMPKASASRLLRAAILSASGCRPCGGAAAGAGAGALRWSEMMRPSRISITRPAREATSRSWVTMTMVWPSAFSSCSRSSSSAPERLSSAPVGSSARITSPPFISARATETRCCCPPDRARGRWPVRLSSPSRSSSIRARLRRVSRGWPA